MMQMMKNDNNCSAECHAFADTSFKIKKERKQ